MMTSKRKIEIFSAGCPVCQETIDLVNKMTCSSCEVIVLDMNMAETSKRAATLGIKSVPAVLVDGQLAGCCSGRGVEETKLRQAGVGQALT